MHKLIIGTTQSGKTNLARITMNAPPYGVWQKGNDAMSSGNQHHHNITRKETGFKPKVNVPAKKPVRSTKNDPLPKQSPPKDDTPPQD